MVEKCLYKELSCMGLNRHICLRKIQLKYNCLFNTRHCQELSHIWRFHDTTYLSSHTSLCPLLKASQLWCWALVPLQMTLCTDIANLNVFLFESLSLSLSTR